MSALELKSLNPAAVSPRISETIESFAAEATLIAAKQAESSAVEKDTPAEGEAVASFVWPDSSTPEAITASPKIPVTRAQLSGKSEGACRRRRHSNAGSSAQSTLGRRYRMAGGMGRRQQAEAVAARYARTKSSATAMPRTKPDVVAPDVEANAAPTPDANTGATTPAALPQNAPSVAPPAEAILTPEADGEAVIAKEVVADAEPVPVEADIGGLQFIKSFRRLLSMLSWRIPLRRA